MNHMSWWHQQDPHLTTCVTITIASTELIWNTFVRLLLAITFASTRWFAINIFMANIIFIKHLKFWAEVGVRKRHPTDSYDDTLRVHSRQCHCLPICFSTSALTNSKKQEPINSDCETSLSSTQEYDRRRLTGVRKKSMQKYNIPSIGLRKGIHLFGGKLSWHRVMADEPTSGLLLRGVPLPSSPQWSQMVLHSVRIMCQASLNGSLWWYLMVVDGSDGSGYIVRDPPAHLPLHRM